VRSRRCPAAVTGPFTAREPECPPLRGCRRLAAPDRCDCSSQRHLMPAKSLQGPCIPASLAITGTALVHPRRWSMRTGGVSLFAFVVLLLAPLLGATDASAQATPGAVTCAATPLAAEPTAFPLTITDDAGRQVTIERSPTRIVSIAPSNTEMLFALGLEERWCRLVFHLSPGGRAKTSSWQLPRARSRARSRGRAGSRPGDGSASGNCSA
jgi:hypothetical protein